MRSISYGDSIVMIRKPNSQVSTLTPAGYWDYFSDKSNKVFVQTIGWVDFMPRHHMYLETGEYTVKGRRIYNFEDADKNKFQCELNDEVLVEVSDVPVQPELQFMAPRPCYRNPYRMDKQ